MKLPHTVQTKGNAAQITQTRMKAAAAAVHPGELRSARLDTAQPFALKDCQERIIDGIISSAMQTIVSMEVAAAEP